MILIDTKQKNSFSSIKYFFNYHSMRRNRYESYILLCFIHSILMMIVYFFIYFFYLFIISSSHLNIVERVSTPHILCLYREYRILSFIYYYSSFTHCVRVYSLTQHSLSLYSHILLFYYYILVEILEIFLIISERKSMFKINLLLFLTSFIY